MREKREIGRDLSGGKRLAARIRTWCLRKGCDLSDLAHQAGVSRTTLYHLLSGKTRRPHISTLNRLAAALEIPPERISDMDSEDARRRAAIVDGGTCEEADRRREFDRHTNHMIAEVYKESPEIFAEWTPDEWDELYSTFGTGGPLSREGVAEAAAKMNRKRETVQRLHVVLETDLGDVAAEMIGTLYKMVRPEIDRPAVPVVAVPTEQPRKDPPERADPCEE